MAGPFSSRGALLRSLRRLGLALGAALAALWLWDRVLDVVARLPPAHQGMVLWGMMAGILLAYALLIALPFVPGVEIGVMLLVMRGAEMAAPVYAATLLGLVGAFLAGRFLPPGALAQVCADLGMTRAAALMTEVEALTPQQRLARLRRALPPWARGLVRYRYLAVALLLNLPGNVVLGGGGGICLAAGLSRIYNLRAMLPLLALAVAPVPLAVWLLGPEALGYGAAVHGVTAD